MSYVINTMTNLASQTGFAFLKPGNFIMVVVALIFLYLAIVKQYEPLLLVPISFGMLLVNLYPPIMQEGGLLHYFYLLDEWSILPSHDLPWGWSIDRLWTTDLPIQRVSFLERQPSLVSMQLIFWQSSYSFQIKRQQRSPSSEEPMDQLLFSLQENLARQLIWDRLRWQHILICL